eukprot:PhF_6_TR15589/c0_g1_i1/m.24193
MTEKVYTPKPNKFATGPIVWHPVGTFEVSSTKPGAEYVKAPLLIDTGAFESCVPHSLGEMMGFAPRQAGERLHTYVTATGEKKYLLRDMNVKIKGQPVKIPVGWGVDDDSTGVIGRRGILNKYDIVFMERKNKMDFIPRHTSH